MAEAPASSVESSEGVDPLVAVFRHDVHKLRGRRHGSAADVVCGVRVNDAVACGADRDAAVLSRPSGSPEQSVANHASPARLSLVTGDRVADSSAVPASPGEIRGLVASCDPAELHAAWLGSEVAARFNESVYYPYTSLKFHTLLVAALLDNYRAGHGFEDLCLVAARPGDEASEEVRSGVRTVLWTPVVALRVTGEPSGEGGVAGLGGAPARSFADVWSRVDAQPLVTDHRWWRVLDAELRRIRSWSTALQFIEDFVATFGPDVSGMVPGGGGRDA